SALDDPAAHALFAMLRTRLPDTQIVSVAHHDSVIDLHPRRTRLTPGKSGAMHLVPETETV
ncbi:MAG TPA: hypothetical protein VF286_14460, partial [Acidiphilium sp.]